MTPTTAAVHLVGPLLAEVRPAAFVWQTAQGIAWLEPGYLSAEPSGRPMFHTFTGAREDMPQGLVVTGERGTALVFDAEAAADSADLVPADVAEDLERFRSALDEAGVTWEDERARMALQLADDLEAEGGLV